MDILKANWKTSLIALGLVIVTIGHAFQTGTVDMKDVMAIFAALGFSAAADAKQ